MKPDLSQLSREQLATRVKKLLKEALRAAELAERLTVCECGRLFVRQGKRRFCSPRCQKRVYMRRRRGGAV
jgi:uncharacterized paraquat-inducible protein A